MDKIFSSEFYSEIQVWNQNCECVSADNLHFSHPSSMEETPAVALSASSRRSKSLPGLFLSMVLHWHSLDPQQRPGVGDYWDIKLTGVSESLCVEAGYGVPHPHTSMAGHVPCPDREGGWGDGGTRTEQDTSSSTITNAAPADHISSSSPWLGSCPVSPPRLVCLYLGSWYSRSVSLSWCVEGLAWPLTWEMLGDTSRQ